MECVLSFLWISSGGGGEGIFFHLFCFLSTMSETCHASHLTLCCTKHSSFKFLKLYFQTRDYFCISPGVFGLFLS